MIHPADNAINPNIQVAAPPISPSTPSIDMTSLAERTEGQRVFITPEIVEPTHAHHVEISNINAPNTPQTAEQAKPHWKETAAKVALAVGFIGFFACGIAIMVSPAAPFAIPLIGAAFLLGGYMSSVAFSISQTSEPPSNLPVLPQENENQIPDHEPQVTVESTDRPTVEVEESRENRQGVRSNQPRPFAVQKQKLEHEIGELESQSDLSADQKERLTQARKDLALHMRLDAQISVGAERLHRNIANLQQAKPMIFHINEHNLFANAFLNIDEVQLEFTMFTEGSGTLDENDRIINSAADLYTPPTSSLPTTMVTGLYFTQNVVESAARNFLDENKRRQEAGQPLITKLFIPFVAEGNVNHAITAVIELSNPDDPNSARIAIVNPMGGGYQETAKALENNLKRVFGSNTPCVHNRKQQQQDVLYCGLHQILNIKHWIDKGQNNSSYSVFDDIKNGILPDRPVQALQRIGERLELALKQELNR